MLLDTAKPADAQTTPPPHEISAAMRALMRFDPDTGVVSFNHGGADPVLVRQFIRSMAADLLVLPGALAGLPVEHLALGGMLTRTMFIPKGTLLAGKIHRLDCINIVAQGDISILTEHGSGRMVAGQRAISPAGTQKLGFANEDTIFINVFRTDETRLEHIEDAIAWPSFDAFDRAQQAATAIGGN